MGLLLTAYENKSIEGLPAFFEIQKSDILQYLVIISQPR